MAGDTTMTEYPSAPRTSRDRQAEPAPSNGDAPSPPARPAGHQSMTTPESSDPDGSLPNQRQVSDSGHWTSCIRYSGSLF